MLARAGMGERRWIWSVDLHPNDEVLNFLDFHGYDYLRLDGFRKIEQRQVVTERFNVGSRTFAFITPSRSGGVGINLTGADTVIFYDRVAEKDLDFFG
ncbi:unnamed protein product [Rhizoctonia solani]|uniref:Helicase C-terminal domain-containing protein n=1 Tax=Rhizoctonia solani TaxID=456999 RepID=A0A8H2WXT4_9AGAM|nr:unnamed protein product [Rhizoctonia solani]